jgi:hypothetical protein
MTAVLPPRTSCKVSVRYPVLPPPPSFTLYSHHFSTSRFLDSFNRIPVVSDSNLNLVTGCRDLDPLGFHYSFYKSAT